MVQLRVPRERIRLILMLIVVIFIVSFSQTVYLNNIEILNAKEPNLPSNDYIQSIGKSKQLYNRTLFVVGTNGRLGNHMFQYASAYGIARKTNSNLVMSSQSILPQYFTGLTFPFNGKDDYIRTLPKVAEEKTTTYSPQLIENLPQEEEMYLCCYLESWKYFEGFEEDLRSQYCFSADIEEKARVFTTQARQAAQDLYGSRRVTLVGVHVRRGDKAGMPEAGWNLPGPTYFKKAMNLMKHMFNNVYFVLISEDYDWCQRHIGRKGITYSTPGISPGQDMAYMSKCDHVIMSVGTMGWWAGWLSGGHVIYFNKPIMPGTVQASQCTMSHLFPNKTNWTPMSN